MESFKDVQHLWNINKESWSERRDITKGKVSTKCPDAGHSLLYHYYSFWHSLILGSPTVIYIPDVSFTGLWQCTRLPLSRILSRKIIVRAYYFTWNVQWLEASNLSFSLHSNYLLLPVVMEMLCLVQGSYQYAVSFGSEILQSPLHVSMCVHMCTWVCQRKG